MVNNLTTDADSNVVAPVAPGITSPFVRSRTATPTFTPGWASADVSAAETAPAAAWSGFGSGGFGAAVAGGGVVVVVGGAAPGVAVGVSPGRVASGGSTRLAVRVVPRVRPRTRTLAPTGNTAAEEGWWRRPNLVAAVSSTGCCGRPW